MMNSKVVKKKVENILKSEAWMLLSGIRYGLSYMSIISSRKGKFRWKATVPGVALNSNILDELKHAEQSFSEERVKTR